MMGQLRTKAVGIWMALAIIASGVSAADSADFYLNLLRRGTSHVDAGQYESGIRELRIAAFGLVDNIPQFEAAHIYIAIAANHLGRESDARRAAQRVLTAERIERRYNALAIPHTARATFEEIASKLLTSDQFAFLRGGPPASSMPQTASPSPAPAPAPSRVTEQPQPQPASPVVQAPAPQPQPQPARPQPARPQPQTGSPAIVPTPVPQPVPAHPSAPAPAPVQKPVSQPQRPVPSPVTPQPEIERRPVPVPVPSPKTPQPAPARTAPVPVAEVSRPSASRSAANIAAELTLADKALDRDDLLTARGIYRSLIDEPAADHAVLLRMGEGAYRARDFATAARAFRRSGFRAGEEPYRYYYAVALYETGQYRAAKKELALALPHIEITRDVARYRAKIEAAGE